MGINPKVQMELEKDKQKNQHQLCRGYRKKIQKKHEQKREKRNTANAIRAPQKLAPKKTNTNPSSKETSCQANAEQGPPAKTPPRNHRLAPTTPQTLPIPDSSTEGDCEFVT